MRIAKTVLVMGFYKRILIRLLYLLFIPAFLYCCGCTNGHRSGSEKAAIEFQLEAADGNPESVTEENTKKACAIINQRIKHLKAKATIERSGKIAVIVFDKNNRERARNLITRRGRIEIKLSDTSKIKNFTAGQLAQIDTQIDGVHIKGARPVRDHSNFPAVEFFLDREGSRILSELTEKNIDKYLAIVLDGKVLIAPKIKGKITQKGIISGDYSMVEAEDIAALFRSGELSLDLKIKSETARN